MRYSYECDSCRKEFDVVCGPSDVQHYERCPDCGEQAVRSYTPLQVNVFHEYVTPHITGSPVRVGSRREQNDLCQRNGVARVTSDEFHEPAKRKPIRMPSLKDEYLRTKQEMGLA